MRNPSFHIDRIIIFFGILIGVATALIGHVLTNDTAGHTRLFWGLSSPIAFVVLFLLFSLPKKWDNITKPLAIYSLLFGLIALFLVPFTSFLPYEIFSYKLHVSPWIDGILVIFIFWSILRKSKKDK